MGSKYTESDYTKKYKETLEGLESAKPTDYQSQYTQAAQDSLNSLLNRKAFQYDVNEDALWQQAKDNYIKQGRMAMQDTMGQAAAMTGGYGNSYAQGVGQQAYQGYLQQLNDSLPEYYQQALNAYNTEGDRLKEQYGLLADQENQDYSRYQDAWNRWNTAYQNAQSGYEAGRNWDYSLAQDNAALAQTQVDYLLSMGVTPNEELLAAAGYDQQYIDQVIKANTPTTQTYYGGSGGDGTGTEVTGVGWEERAANSKTGHEMLEAAKAAGATSDEYLELYRELNKAGMVGGGGNTGTLSATYLRDKLFG